MTTGRWIVVALAGVLAAAPLGVLLTWSVWRDTARRTRRRLVPGVLALHAGAAIVIGAVATGAAIRTWQIMDHPAGHYGAALLQVSHIDGDASLYQLLTLLLVGGTGLVVLLLALSARFAITDDATERSIACAVLGVEVGACGYGLARVVTGHPSAPAIVAALHVPLLVAAMVRCWPSAHVHEGSLS